MIPRKCGTNTPEFLTHTSVGEADAEPVGGKQREIYLYFIILLFQPPRKPLLALEIRLF